MIQMGCPNHVAQKILESIELFSPLSCFRGQTGHLFWLKVFEQLCSPIQCRSPRGRDQLIALFRANHRLFQTIAGQTIVGKPSFITQPGLIDLQATTRHHPFDFIIQMIDTLMTANRTVCTDTVALLQLPASGLEMEGLIVQCSHWTNLCQVAGQFGGEWARAIGTNLHMVASINRSHFRGTSNLIGETDAAGAVNAPVHLCFQQRTEIIIVGMPFLLIIARAVWTILHGQILQ